MRKYIYIALISAAIVTLSGCKVMSNQAKTAGNYTYKTECLGVEGDGTQTVKAWGKGRNNFDAYAQARKNAVSDVIFKGISDGTAECEMRPLVPEVNARQKYEDYFNNFFKDGGEYRKYVSMKDEQLEHRIDREKTEGIGTVTLSAVIVVKRPQLKAKLIADGILQR